MLHRHRRQPSWAPAVRVVLAQGVSELVIDQKTPVVCQVGSARHPGFFGVRLACNLAGLMLVIGELME